MRSHAQAWDFDPAPDAWDFGSAAAAIRCATAAGGSRRIAWTFGSGAAPLARLEPFGMLILIGILILLPLAGSQFGLNLDIISTILRTMTGYVIQLLLVVTGNA